MNMLTELNETYGISGHVTARAGEGGFPVIELIHRSGGSVVTTLYGAQVISWKDGAHREQLFLSPRAVFSPGKAIRGGVPIIFPQFGPGPLPTHGFARTREWTLIGSALLDDGAVSATFELANSQETMQLWPYEFEARLTINLSDALSFDLLVRNNSADTVTMQTAFHTYFPVSDIARVQILGLEQREYLNNLRQRARESGQAHPLRIDQEVDRVYLNVPNPTTIADLQSGTTVQITKHGMSDVVVWNPWIEKSKTLADLEPTGYRNFLCVETGAIATPLSVPSQQSAACGQSIRIIRT